MWSIREAHARFKYRKRTRTVVSALEEAYLREDVACGVESCPSCGPPSSSSLDPSAPYLVMPDADVLSHYLDVWELPELTNWVLCTSVMRRFTQDSNLRKSTRLRSLYRDRRRRVFVFDDVHCMWTAPRPQQEPSCPQAPAGSSSLSAGTSTTTATSSQSPATWGQPPDSSSTSVPGAKRRRPALLTGAEYYWEHLGQATPVVVVSDRLSGAAQADQLMTLLQRLQLVDQGGTWVGGITTGSPGKWGTTGADTSSQGPSSVATTSGTSSLLPPSSAASSLPLSVLSSTTAASSTATGPDPSLLQRLHQQGVVVMSAPEFFMSLCAHQPAVLDVFDSLLQARVARVQEEAQGGEGTDNSQVITKTEAGKAGGAGSGTDPGLAMFSQAHWSQQAIEEGLAAGSLLQGVVHVSARSRQEGVVVVGAGPSGTSGSMLGRLLRLSGLAAINRAMHGDRVAVRLLESAGGASPATPSLGGTEAGEGDNEDEGGGGDAGELLLGDQGIDGEEEGAEAVLASGDTSSLLSAEVVGILSRGSPRGLVACLSLKDEEALRDRAGGALGSRRQESVLAVPYDSRMPFVRLRTRLAGRLVGQRFLLRVDGWARGSRYPDGHVVRVLGPVNDLKAEAEAVLEHAGITWQPFCQAALSELPRVPGGDPGAWEPSPQEREARRDLTGPDYFICSIDPVGCTDVDDALHARVLQPGLYEVGVHIADVSFFVTPGSMLDGEARDRCTSVYLVDRRLDMLPSLLSEHLCSLRSGVERYAVSVIWALTEGKEGKLEVVGSPWFGRSIIRSRHQLHYQQAQDVLDGCPPAPGDELPPSDLPDLRQGLQLLRRLTAQLHSQRLADGALELESAELRFKTDPATGLPQAVLPKQKVPMMDIVAEMMIAANAAVAHRIATTFPGASLLRNHPPPRRDAFEPVRALLERELTGSTSTTTTSPQVDVGSNRSLSTALAAACRSASRRDAAAASLLKSLATRAMSEAKYFSTGAAAPGTAGAYHYGLALSYYTHFTSPIRRYADIVVHRQLMAALAVDRRQGASDQANGAVPVPLAPPPIPHAELAMAAERMNDQHRAAKAAQKECSQLYLLLLLHKQPHVESALVVEVQAGALDVFVPAYHLRGRVNVVDTRSGLVRLPLTGGPSDLEEGDAFADAERQHYAYRPQPDGQSADIIDTRTGARLWEGAVWSRVWVQLSADGSRAHGPRLAMRLVSHTHPEALAKAAAAQAAGLPPPAAATTLAPPIPATALGNMPPGIAALFGPRGPPPALKHMTPATSQTQVPEKGGEEARQAAELSGGKQVAKEKVHRGPVPIIDVVDEARCELLVATHPAATVTLPRQQVEQSEHDQEGGGPGALLKDAHQQLRQLLLVQSGRLAARLSASSLSSSHSRQQWATKLGRLQDELERLDNGRGVQVQAGVA